MKFSYAILFALAGWNHSISAQQYLKMSYYKSPNCTTLVVTATPKIGQCYSDIESCRAQMGESYCTQSGIETKKIGERSSEKFVLKGDVVEYNFYAGSLDCSSTPTVQTAKLYVCANNRNITLTDKPLQFQTKGGSSLINSWAIVGQQMPWIWIVSFAMALFVLL